MGARCSSAGIIMPSKKSNNNSSVPNSDRGKRNSLPDNRAFHSEQNTPRGVISAENATSVTIKQRRVQTEANEGSQKFDKGSPLNETNNSKSTEIPNVKGIYLYQKGPLIGKGSYGEVYECLNLNTGELLAVKSYKVQGDLARVLSYVETLKKEVVILKNLAHENIVKYYTTEISDVKDGDHVTVDIVQEYVSGGSVRKLLDKFNKLEERVVGTYVRQVLQGLHYLHMQGIYHRNIKGSNILIDTSGTIKLTEFGYSGKPDKFSEDGTENKPSNKTPAYWSAPEVVLKKSQGMPADIWSVGCIVIEMLTGSPPWSGQIKNMDDFIKKITTGATPSFPTEISEACIDFLTQTFKSRADERPTVIDLLEHPFVREDDNLNNSSYMEAESVMGGGISRTQTPANFLNLVDGRHSERPFPRTKTNTTGFQRQDSNGSGFEGDLRQNSGLSGYKDFMAGFKGNVADSVSGGGSATRQNSEDNNMLAMFKAYGFENTASRQNSADKNHLVAFKANAHDAASRQNSEDKGMLAAFKAGAMDFRMKTEHTKNLATFVNNLRNVEEEGDEEEATPHPNSTAELLRFGSGAKVGTEQPQKNKEDMRKEIEAKMMRDLMRMNTAHLSEFGLTEEVEEDENGQVDENKTKANSPLKNKLVENLDSSKKKKSLVSEFDFNANNNKVVMITEMEMDDVKQKLRKEFENQLESSLARINTEKLTHLIDREPKEAPAVARHTTVAARLIRDAMKSEESAPEEENPQNPIWAQNIGEDLGSFRGFSENTNNYGAENKLGKNFSPMKSDSDNNSPAKNRVFKKENSVIPEGEETKESIPIINMKSVRQVQAQVV